MAGAVLEVLGTPKAKGWGMDAEVCAECDHLEEKHGRPSTDEERARADPLIRNQYLPELFERLCNVCRQSGGPCYPQEMRRG